MARRNLNNFQRSETQIRIEDITRRKAKEQQKRKPQSVFQKSGKQKLIHTDEILAKKADVSKDTIHKTRVILEKAPNVVKERVRSGEISVNRAYIDTVAPERERPP